MKFCLVGLCLLMFIACNELQDAPVASKKEEKKDSGLQKKELANPYSPTDVSPMDISYFPPDYPVFKMSNPETGPPVARVIYSRPHRQGRKIFGSLLKYNQPWRLGANEASEIDFFQPVIIQNKKINKGRYIIYCIPQQNKWTIILNNSIYSWGLKIEAKKDVYTFEVPVQKLSPSIEYFTMVFQPAATGADLIMAWDEVQVRLPITIE